MKKIFLILLIIGSQKIFAQLNTTQENLLSSIVEFSKTSAVTGREEEARNYLTNLFEKGLCKQDRLGNVVISIGSGAPKRLFTVALDEPGYVISQIQEDGYLRITPLGFGHQGTLYHQFLEGNEVKINTEKNTQIGVSTVPSSHYDLLRAVPEKSKNAFQWQEAFVDVGVSSSAQVAAKGIKLLDPLTINKKPIVISNKYIAAPSVNSKAAVIALATVANTLLHQKFSGTVVIAFTTLELINGKGIEAVVNNYGPFDQIIRYNRFLNGPRVSDNTIFVNKLIPNIAIGQQQVSTSTPLKNPYTNGPNWSKAMVYETGMSSVYTSTPVEMVSVNTVESLTQLFLQSIDNKKWDLVNLKKYNNPFPNYQYSSFQKEEKMVANLVSKYGVSPDEKPVREYILSKLPTWAKPTVDEKGNIILEFGKGDKHIAFVAHMDEVGFQVDSILNDGRLALKEIGGFFNWVWEGHSALVHLDNKDINAVFEPRDNYLQENKRHITGHSLLVNAGFTSKQEALLAGVKPKQTTVTMPKKMIRLSDSKATARGFDDRVGCAALLMALENINPNTIPYKVSFIWTVGEETGLVGSTFAEQFMKDVSVGYPIDTYVSSDAPMESKIFGYCPLGKGAIVRVLESVNFVSRENLTYLQKLANNKNIKLQYGMTAGGTDGQGFLANGIPSVPLSWPGRYSHSPIEVMDFNDMKSLTQLINAIILEGPK